MEQNYTAVVKQDGDWWIGWIEEVPETEPNSFRACPAPIIGRTTIQRILEANGIGPVPERQKRVSWETFLQSHWGVIAVRRILSSIRRFVSSTRQKLPVHRENLLGRPQVDHGLLVSYVMSYAMETTR